MKKVLAFAETSHYFMLNTGVETATYMIGAMLMSYSLNKKEMGRRLSIVRKIEGRELDEAAKAIGMSASRLASAERGSIALKTDEVDSLAYFYGISPVRIAAHSAIHTDLIPRFKMLSKTEDKHVFEAAKLMNNLFSAEVELENLLEIKHATNYPKEFDISNGDAGKLAAEHARFLREFLELGNGQIPDIFSVIREKLGIRLYQRKLEKESKILGMFAFDKNLGACILLNANYPRPSRALAAAHELGHFMTDRKEIEVLEENDQNNSRNERYAKNFSYAFMMPEESFTNSYKVMSVGPKVLTQKIAVELANRFHVPISACIRQLEEYGLAENANNWFNSLSDIKPSNKRKMLGNEQYCKRYTEVEDANQYLPNRMALLVHKALDGGIASEGFLSSMLKLGRLEIREIFYDIENGSLA